MKHYLRFMLVLLLSTVWCVGGYSQETVTDELTYSVLGLTGKSYTKFSGKKATSDAVYSGYAYKNSSNIQIKTDKQNKDYTGIVSSVSGGKIKKITISGVQSKKSIDIYCSNNVYSSPDDLFGSKAGTKVGTITSSNSSVEISDDYSYIGIRSNNGAVYMYKITIVWEKVSSKTPTTTTFGDGVDEHTFTITEGEPFPTHVATMTTAGVTGTIAYASDNDAAVKVDQNGVTSVGTGFGMAKITATFTPSDADADKYASSSAYYYIDYKEKTKPATAISFGKPNVTLTTLDYASFKGQTATLKAGETILTNELTYSKEDAAGVITTLNNNDGALVLSGNEGTATVTATFAGNDEYASSTASYTITVVDPNKLEVTFDFTKPNLYGYDVPASGSGTSLEEGNTINSGVVTITNVKSGGNGTNTTKSVFHNKKGAITLRFYINAEATVSVPVGYEINKIEFITGNNASDNITITPGNYDSNASTWTGSANTVSLTFNDAVWFTSMTVSYTKVDLPTVTFDEEKDDNYNNLSVYDKKTVNVTMKRTIGTGYLNPVCFPFAMKDTQITEVFGEGSKVSSMSMKMPDGNLHFDYVENMEAGKPYLVEPTKASTTIEIKNVKINAVDLKPGSDVAEDNDGNMYLFQGTFEPYAFTTTDGTELFLGKDNTLYMPQSVGQKMKGFRAYFTTTKANGSLKVVVNGQTTTISSLMSGKTMTGKVYNLNGQYVGTSLEGLAKGVYVMNGQKFVVK